jgi:hypothetical protein
LPSKPAGAFRGNKFGGKIGWLFDADALGIG